MFSWVPNTPLFVEESNNVIYLTKVNENEKKKGNPKLNWYFFENLYDQICGTGSDKMAVIDWIKAHRIFVGYIFLKFFAKYMGNITTKFFVHVQRIWFYN